MLEIVELPDGTLYVLDTSDDWEYVKAKSDELRRDYKRRGLGLDISCGNIKRCHKFDNHKYGVFYFRPKVAA